jgi:hypothetical protein
MLCSTRSSVPGNSFHPSGNDFQRRTSHFSGLPNFPVPEPWQFSVDPPANSKKILTIPTTVLLKTSRKAPIKQDKLRASSPEANYTD